MRKTVVALALATTLAACQTTAMNETEQGEAITSSRDGPMVWTDLLTRPKPAADATISYGDDPLNVIDIWTPEGPGPHPAVIMIHGGCWRTDIAERDIMNWIADDLRKDGIGVWNIEYRGVDRGGGYPATYQDVGAAADLFAARGGEFGLDTAKRIAIGHSAGGHLALWLGNRPALGEDSDVRGSNPIRIDAAISQAGLPDLRTQITRKGHPCGTDAARDMSRGNFSATSPVEMPLTDTKQYIFNTERDHVAPPAYGEDYRRRMADRGVTVVSAMTDGEGHIEHIAPDGRIWALQKELIKQLLARK